MRRYVAIVAEGSEVFRMLQQNQAAVNSLAAAKGRGELFRERMSALIEQFAEPAASAEDRLRAADVADGIDADHGDHYAADEVSLRRETHSGSSR
jgi:hypothetical protein